MKAFANVTFLGVSSRVSGTKTYYNVDCKADDGLHSIATREPDRFKDLDDGTRIYLELNIFTYRGYKVVNAVGAQLLGDK